MQKAFLVHDYLLSSPLAAGVRDRVRPVEYDQRRNLPAIYEDLLEDRAVLFSFQDNFLEYVNLLKGQIDLDRLHISPPVYQDYSSWTFPKVT